MSIRRVLCTQITNLEAHWVHSSLITTMYLAHPCSLAFTPQNTEPLMPLGRKIPGFPLTLEKPPGRFLWQRLYQAVLNAEKLQFF